MQQKFSKTKGWIVIEQRRVPRGEHGEVLERTPLSRIFPSKDDADKQLPSFSPQRGGQLFVIPASEVFGNRERAKPRLRREARRDHR